jgi:D-alanyl-lipoteichoic acid acyltransferase DltB (MBOAT superfamily)
MAIGLARTLGFRLKENFNAPYVAQSLTDFWRRWHISLSTWLRDYLYLPLGGNRRGAARTYINLLVVMALGGLWHGASWNFVVWGIYHGLLLCLHRLWRHASDGVPALTRLASPVLAPLRIAITFTLVTIGWVPFRAPDFATTLATLKALVAMPDMTFLASNPGIAIIALASLAWCLLDWNRRVQDFLVERASWKLAVASATLLAIALEACARVDAQIPFVYFRF